MERGAKETKLENVRARHLFPPPSQLENCKGGRFSAVTEYEESICDTPSYEALEDIVENCALSPRPVSDRNQGSSEIAKGASQPVDHNVFADGGVLRSAQKRDLARLPNPLATGSEAESLTNRDPAFLSLTDDQKASSALANDLYEEVIDILVFILDV